MTLLNDALPRLARLLAMLTLALCLGAAPGMAQDQPADAPADATTATATATEEAAPSYPADMTDMAMDAEDFGLRLVPLTADQLTELAAAWQDIVRDQTQAVTDATIASRKGDGDPSAEDLDKIVTLTAKRSEGFARFNAVINNLEKKGGDEAAIASYRAYRSAVLLEEKQQADTRTLAKMALNWMTAKEGGIKLAWNVAVIVGAFIGLMIVARIVRGYARRLFTRIPDLSMLLQSFLSLVVYWLTIAVGLMVVLSALGVDVTPLFALLGGASFIVAFAMQDTLGNLAAGLMIMFNRPFDQGDYVTAGGTSGTVKSVSVVSTTVATPDNQIIVIPNSKVWGDVITNTTASDIRRVDMVFGIGYDDSIADAQRILEEVVSAHPAVLEDPAPVIRVSELADSSVNFIVRPWTRSEDYWSLLWDLTRTVKEAFDAQGISIPYPQADMHLKVEKAALPAITGSAAVPSSGDKTGLGKPEGAQDFAAGDDGDGNEPGEDTTAT